MFTTIQKQKPKLIAACMPVFSCILYQPHEINLYSDWLIVPFVSVVIGQSIYYFLASVLQHMSHMKSTLIDCQW